MKKRMKLYDYSEQRAHVKLNRHVWHEKSYGQTPRFACGTLKTLYIN